LQLARGAADGGDQRRHRKGLLQPAERNGLFGARAGFGIGMRCGEDAADAMGHEYLDGGLDTVARSGEPDIHHAQGRPLRRRKLDRFVGRRSDAGDCEPGIDQGRLDLRGDQEIVFDQQNALGRHATRPRPCAFVARKNGTGP
jgi:hypothetical protein